MKLVVSIKKCINWGLLLKWIRVKPTWHKVLLKNKYIKKKVDDAKKPKTLKD